MNDIRVDPNKFHIGFPIWTIFDCESQQIVVIETEHGLAFALFSDEDLATSYMEEELNPNKQMTLRFDESAYLRKELVEYQKRGCKFVGLDFSNRSPVKGRPYEMSAFIESLPE